MSVVKQYSGEATVKELVGWTDLPRSSCYYKPGNGRKGIPPSTVTHKIDGTLLSNGEVVEEIKGIISGEFVCYGYQNVASELRDRGFIINHKKVYRLMGENGLLLGKAVKTNGKRDFVRFRKIVASRPMEYLCWDIKYVWIGPERKNYYLLSIMDVYSRRIIDWIFQGSIKKTDLLKMVGRLDLAHGLKGVTVRNDNGSQFMANKVINYLRFLEAKQEFTHVATPEENSYIEAFHSILQREVIERFDFQSFYEAKTTLKDYMEHYNNYRKHGSLKRKTPAQKWNEYYRPLSSDKQQTAEVSEVLSRVPALAGTCLALDKSGDTAIFASRGMNGNERINEQNILNSFYKSVQVIGG
jgi:transposase InsO family protein